jgi:uncharacterized repeat protein (TIGR03847 family)
MTNGPAYSGTPFFEAGEVRPVTRITAGAVGDAGRRVFLLQAQIAGGPVTWVIEKEQAIALSRTLPVLLEGVREEFPELGDPLVAAEPNLELAEPLEPEFRVGSMGVSYDRLHDLVILTLVDASLFDADPEEDGEDDEDDSGPVEHQVFTTRGQAKLLGEQAGKVVAGGRPLCPGCSEPIDSFGHFCLSEQARKRRGGEYLH